MIIDLYVDTSRKGISMAVATGGQPEGGTRVYEEIVNTEARGEATRLFARSMRRRPSFLVSHLNTCAHL